MYLNPTSYSKLIISCLSAIPLLLMGFKLMAGAVASCALIGVAVGCLIHRYLFTVNGERGTDVAIR